MFNYTRNIIGNFLVAIYIRLSKEDEKLGESESIQNQRDFLIKYVEDSGYTLVDIYIDDGYTGTNFDRPGFQKMLKDIENKKINMVVTKDMSRLGRDYIKTGEYVENWFPAHKVRYVSVSDGIDTFVESSNLDVAPFKSLLNDMYSKDISKKIRVALYTMQSNGKWVGGCTPFGYKPDSNDKNHLVIDEVEAPIVKKIFNLYLKGLTIAEVAKKLNLDNEPTFSITRHRNFERVNAGTIVGKWCTCSVKKILRNEMYTGALVQKKRRRISYKYRKLIPNPKADWIIVRDTHEPIISKEDFDKVQDMLPAQTKRNDKKNIYLLDGLLYCADCGHTICIPNRKKHNNYRTYTICNLYRRYPGDMKLCTSHSVNYDKLEEKVIGVIKEIFQKINIDKVKSSLENCENKTNDIITSKKNKLSMEIQMLEKNLEDMYMDKLSKRITEEMYDKVQIRINTEIENKKVQIIELDKNLEENGLKETKDLQKVIEDFISLENPTRELILKIIKRINIHQDKTIDIYFNFKKMYEANKITLHN